MRTKPLPDAPIVRIFRWCACICLVWAAVLLAGRLWFVAHAAHASGTVVRYAEAPHISGRPPTFQVVFSYTLPGGRAVQATGSARRNSVLAYGAVGDTLPVLYNPAHLEEAIPDAWMDLWFAPLIVGATGIFFATFTTVLAYALRR